MTFQKHTSAKMVELFNRKPFQGQHPEKSEIIFLSSDANYSPEISNHHFFDKVVEYQEDGVGFWEKSNYHHPFLLPDYPFNKLKGGVTFHRNFNKLGLTSEYATSISFLELLDIPTIGNKSENMDLFYNLISEEHLRYIDHLILGGGGKLFFISICVFRNMLKFKREYQVFEWLNNSFSRKTQYSKTLGENKIQKIYHFSAPQIHKQLEDIHFSIRNWLRKSDETSN